MNSPNRVRSSISEYQLADAPVSAPLEVDMSAERVLAVFSLATTHGRQTLDCTKAERKIVHGRRRRYDILVPSKTTVVETETMHKL